MTYQPPTLGADEWERLQALLAYPAKYVERRVEIVEMKSDVKGSRSARHQIKLPPPRQGSNPASESAIVSLGLYPKVRLPDLHAVDGEGKTLAILSRDERSHVLSACLMSGPLKAVAAELAQAPPSDQMVFEVMAAHLRTMIANVVASHKSEAGGHIVSLLRELTEFKLNISTYEPMLPPATASLLQGLLANRNFWFDLTTHVNVTHVLACAKGKPNDSITINITWSDRQTRPARADRLSKRSTIPNGVASHPILRLLASWAARGGWWRVAADAIDWLLVNIVGQGLMLMGLASRTLIHRCENAYHAESYYFMINETPGVDIVRLYWLSDETESCRAPTSESNLPHISRYGLVPPERHPATVPEAVLEVQVARSPGLILAALLVGQLAFGAGAVAISHATKSIDVGTSVLQIFSISPGAIVGVLALYSNKLATMLWVGVRCAAGVLGALSVGLVSLLALKAPATAITSLGVMTSILAVFTMMWFLSIFLLPRYYTPNCVEKDFRFPILPAWKLPPGGRRVAQKLHAFYSLVVIVCAVIGFTLWLVPVRRR